MRQPKLAFKDKPAAEQINLARRVTSSLNGDAAMAARAASLDTLQTQITEADAAVAAVAEARSQWRAAVTQRNLTLKHMRRLAQKVALELIVARSTEAELLGAGLELARPRSPIGVLPMPENVRAKGGSHEGTVKLVWNRIPVRGPLYEVQVREEPGGEWRHVETRSRRNCVVKGLVSGRLYGFRVAGFGAAGKGPWSQVARARAA